MTVAQRVDAVRFFERVFRMKELPIMDPLDVTRELFKREMRVYLIKSEQEFQALAYKKYTQDLENRNSHSGSKEKNHSGSRSKQDSKDSIDNRAAGATKRGSRGSRGSKGRPDYNSMEELTTQGSGGQLKNNSAESDLMQSKQQINAPAAMPKSSSVPDLFEVVKPK